MSVDVMASVGAVKQLASSLAGLGSALADAAPDGAFGAVLSQVNSELVNVADGGGGATPTSSGNPSTYGLLGLPAPGSAPSLSSLTSAQAGGAAVPPLVSAGFGPVPAGSGSVSGGGTPATGEAVVTDAQKYLGVPYRWGGTDPATGLDCSGLVQHVYSDLGVSLPRTSQQQATVGTPVASLADARPGDLVFFEPSSSGPGHVGIYIGNGQMIDAPHTGTVVRVDPVGQPVAIRRVIPSSPAGWASLTAASLPGDGSAQSAGMARLGVPPALQPLFAEAGSRYGVDPLLLAAVAKQESGFQAGAVSGAGAEGLMQLMPATAAGLGVSPFDPASAVDGAAQLLSGYLHDYGGSVPMALAAYNAGPAAVAAHGGVPPYAETQGYVSNITAMLARAGGLA